MRIIIAGDGKVGAILTRQLSAEGYDLTLIDANLKVLESTEERYDIMLYDCAWNEFEYPYDCPNPESGVHGTDL